MKHDPVNNCPDWNTDASERFSLVEYITDQKPFYFGDLQSHWIHNAARAEATKYGAGLRYGVFELFLLGA